MTRLLTYFDAYAARYDLYKNGRWCYEDGLLYIGLMALHRQSGERRWLDHLLRLAGSQVGEDGSLAGYTAQEYNIDNILAGRCLFYLAQQTGEARFTRAADLLAAQLASHPRTAGGNYWHKQVYPHQVWLDGLYMGLPFQIEYGLVHRNEALVSDALAQFERALDLTTGPEGLFVHGYDESRSQHWADPVTGQSPAVWARAVGWLVMALVDVCELVPARAPTQRTLALLQAVLRQQQPSGLWQQVLALPDLAGNYEESSASAMIAYALFKAHRLGLIGPEGRRAAELAHDALVRTRLHANNGQDRLVMIVQVAGLGGFGGVYRDGSPGYYLTETIVSDDIKGVGPFITATVERNF